MKFSEFIGKLYERFSCDSKERFVLQIFSALCGEENPIPTSTNEEHLEDKNGNPYTLVGSSTLPKGLRGDDKSATARKALYESSGKGLTAPVREHILGYRNRDTFLAYCENVSAMEFPKLCLGFGLAEDIKDRCVVFRAIFEQFLEFAKTPNDDVADVMQATVSIDIRTRELAYLHSAIASWQRQLAEKVNIKKDVDLEGLEYRHTSVEAETEDITDNGVDIAELKIHAVKMHYQFGSSPTPTDNVCECVQNNDGKVVLLGEPGSGKSVALLKIAIEYAKKAINDEIALIPVLVPLGAYKGNKTIDFFTLSFLGELGEHYTRQNINERVMKIFDALNETISDKAELVVSYIKKQNRFVVSCRIMDYEESFFGIRGVSTIEILPLDPVRICDAVTSELWGKLDGNEHIISAWKKITDTLSNGEDVFWYQKCDADSSSAESEKAREYQHMLEKVDLSPNESKAYRRMLDTGVMPLCRNPLMLSIACGLYSNRKLPDTRGKLIKEFVRKSITDELHNRNITDIQAESRITDILKVAARSIQEKGLGTDTLSIKDLLMNCKSDVLTAIDIARSAGVLTMDVTEKEGVKFYHQLFQEYYASMALQSIIQEFSELDEVFLFNKEKWWESKGWDETIVLLAETTSENGFNNLLLWLAKFQPLLTVRCIENSRDFTPHSDTIKQIQSMWLARIRVEAQSADKRKSIAKIGDAISRIGDTRKGIGNTLFSIVGKQLVLPDIDWRKVNEIPLYVSRNLITVDQFNVFVEDNGYNYATGIWDNIAEFQSFTTQIIAKEKNIDGLNMPVVGVSWFEACAFCNWLSQKTGDFVRLPTSDEWEIIFNQCFYKLVCDGESVSKTFNVAVDGYESRLTASGIYSLSESTTTEDLMGNAWEWCGDRVVDNEDYDPLLDDEPISTRILKGGSWRCRKEYATPSFTLYSFPYCTRSDVGFRVVKAKK